MAGFAFFTLIFLFVRVLVSLVNLLANNYFPPGEPEVYPLLSILIPARNEERTLPVLLEDLSEVTYPNLEIIVCDDHSSDRTREILEKYSRTTGHLTWFRGSPLPEGWAGKNFACDQLAAHARGDYFLFIDADIRLSADMPSKAVRYMQKMHPDLVSVFPNQQMKSAGELATVPLMNWILLSLLPLPLVRHTRFPSLSAANGQFMLFKAAHYRENMWHYQVKGELVEDIIIARMVRQKGGKTVTLAGNNDVFCRMYESGREAVAGFSRNVHQYFGGSAVIMVLFLVTVLLGWLPVYQTWGWTGLKTYGLMVAANRVFVAMASRQGSFSVLFHPLQMLALGMIVFGNLKNALKRKTEWKGRVVKF